MTTNPKAPKFRIRRKPSEWPADPSLKPPTEDGFGDAPFPGSAKAETDAAAETEISNIRREGLTGRQLRMARRLAQKNGLEPKSDFDAVRLLREKGIDPFDPQNMMEVVQKKEARAPQGQPAEGEGKPTPSGAAAVAAAGGATQSQMKTNLPQKIEPAPKNLPGEAKSPADGPMGVHEIERIQRDIIRRRRRRFMFLIARLTAFVVLPTIICFYYFAFIATPSYATKSEFIVQQAETSSAGGGGLLGGTPLAGNQDSILVQDYLTSRGAMQRLDEEFGYREHFSDASIDALQRIEGGSSNETLYKHYQDHVKVGFDPTEGVLRMEVAALSPDMSRVFSEALIGYAEERVDQITERKRADQMRGANESFREAEQKMVDAQQTVLNLQEQVGILDPASETTALMTQIGTLETQLTEKRLQLSQLLDNTRPNQARVAGVEGDVARLEDLIAELRAQLTTEAGDDDSLASITARLSMAEVDLETRTMIMQESLQQLEAARIEANRQVRFLSVGVSPVPPDEPTYPRVFENTMIAFLIFGAIYLLASVTAAILREQVSS